MYGFSGREVVPRGPLMSIEGVGEERFGVSVAVGGMVIGARPMFDI